MNEQLCAGRTVATPSAHLILPNEYEELISLLGGTHISTQKYIEGHSSDILVSNRIGMKDRSSLNITDDDFFKELFQALPV